MKGKEAIIDSIISDAEAQAAEIKAEADAKGGGDTSGGARRSQKGGGERCGETRRKRRAYGKEKNSRRVGGSVEIFSFAEAGTDGRMFFNRPEKTARP